MDTTSLEQAYRQLFDVCAGGLANGFRSPANSAGWTAEQVLAHVASNDRLLLATTANLLAGTLPRDRPAYDNSAAVVPEALDMLARAAGDVRQLVATVRQTGRELVLLARRLEPAIAVRPVDVRLVDGGDTRVDGPVPWTGVLATQAEVHLPARTDQLAGLRR